MFYCKARYVKRSSNKKSILYGELAETMLVLRNNTDKQKIGKYHICSPIHPFDEDDMVRYQLK